MSYQLLRNIYSDASGNIGIGTLTPKSSLDISGSIAISNYINLNGTLIQKTQSGNLVITDVSNNKLDGEYNNLLVSGNVDVSGNIQCNNLTVNGTTTTIQSTVVTVEDPIIKLGGDVSNNKDKGIEFTYFDTTNKKGFIGYKNATGNFTLLKDATNTSEVFTGTQGTLELNAIGIGTSVPTGSIDVRGNVIMGFPAGQYMGFNAYYGGSPAIWRNVVASSTTPSFVIRSENTPVSKVQLAVQPGNSAANAGVTFIERMCIKTDGNVGIGTINPLNSLHVEQNSSSLSTQLTLKNPNASGRAGLELSSGGTSSFNIQSANGTGILENIAGTINFYAKGGGSYTFHTTGANSARLIIANNGNVSVVNGTFDVSGNMTMRDGNASNPSLTYSSDTNTGFYRPGADTLGLVTNGSERVRVDANGNVGIGTSNPQAKLHIVGSAKGIPGIYATGNISGLTTDIPIDNTYGMSVIYWKLRTTNSTLIRFNMLLRFQINGIFHTSGYEKNVMATYNNNGTTINYINIGAGDGPILLYYADNFQDNAGEIRVFSPGLISRTQVQYDSSYTYGGIGATRTYGSAHLTSGGTEITAIRLVVYQFDASNIPTGATGSYSVMGIPT